MSLRKILRHTLVVISVAVIGVVALNISYLNSNAIVNYGFTTSKISVRIGLTRTIPFFIKTEKYKKGAKLYPLDKKYLQVSSGKVKGLKVGTSFLRLKLSNGYYKTLKVVVTPRIKSKSVSFKAKSYVVYKGNNVTSKWSVVSAVKGKVSNDTLKFTSSKPTVASVNGKGVILGRTPGTTIITLRTESGKISTTTVVVRSIRSIYPELKLKKGVTDTFSLAYYNIPSTTLKTYWVSDETKLTIPALREKNAESADDVNSNKLITSNAITFTALGGAADNYAYIYAQVPDGSRVTIKVTFKLGAIIDVSYWNYGKVTSWPTLANSLEYMIIRASSYPHGFTASNNYEDKYSYYASNCKKYGIPFGAYVFNYFNSVAQAKTEARLFFDDATRNGAKPNFFFLDMESDGSWKHKKNGTETVRAQTRAFISELRAYAKSKGYGNRIKVGVYIANHLYKEYNLDLVRNTADSATPDIVWIPHYGTNTTGKIWNATNSTFNYTDSNGKVASKIIDMWQYASAVARVAGISGDVDVNTIYFSDNSKISKKSFFNINYLTE